MVVECGGQVWWSSVVVKCGGRVIGERAVNSRRITVRVDHAISAGPSSATVAIVTLIRASSWHGNGVKGQHRPLISFAYNLENLYLAMPLE